jgi:hypothetical protein
MEEGGIQIVDQGGVLTEDEIWEAIARARRESGRFFPADVRVAPDLLSHEGTHVRLAVLEAAFRAWETSGRTLPSGKIALTISVPRGVGLDYTDVDRAWADEALILVIQGVNAVPLHRRDFDRLFELARLVAQMA